MTLRATPPESSVPTRGWWVLVASLAVLGSVWFAYQGWRALETSTGSGAIDLRLRHAEVTDWLAGRPVYAEHHDAMYPPASYALLAIVHGPLELHSARIVWLALELVLAVAIGRGLARAAGAHSGPLRWVFLLLPFGTYPLGAAIGNGQLGAPVLAALLALTTRLERPPAVTRGLGPALWLALLAVVALVKPTLSAPFFWLLVARGGALGVIASVALYALLTWLASLWQTEGPLGLLQDWYERSRVGALYGATRGEGSIQFDADGDGWRVTHINLHSLLAAVGQARQAALATGAALVLVGIWVLTQRRASVWILGGVTAIVARSMTYHAWYDDVVLLIPVVALWRLYCGRDPSSPRTARSAGALQAANLGLLLAPGAVYALPRAYANAAVLLHTAVLLATLVLLVVAAGQARAPRSG